jgi:quercetin dioxygenase-like cupin family protein
MFGRSTSKSLAHPLRTHTGKRRRALASPLFAVSTAADAQVFPFDRAHARGGLMRMSKLVTVMLAAGAATAACSDRTPTDTAASSAQADPASAESLVAPPPILAEPLTGRHEFTDDVAVQVRLMLPGRSREVINIHDASRIAVVKFTVQPGVRFPWHSHPGLVMVAVTQGELVFVLGDDCVERSYPSSTAFVDPGFGNVHYAFNRTEGETIIVATFLGVPPAPDALTIPVSAAEAAALDAKCLAAPASLHIH